jgi:hypothetical protein
MLRKNTNRPGRRNSSFKQFRISRRSSISLSKRIELDLKQNKQKKFALPSIAVVLALLAGVSVIFQTGMNTNLRKSSVNLDTCNNKMLQFTLSTNIEKEVRIPVADWKRRLSLSPSIAFP